MANVTITIPDSPSPVYTVTVNGVKYSYPSGKRVPVPDFVAEVIRHSEDSKPKPGVPGDPADYDSTGFIAHIRIVPGAESESVSINDALALAAYRDLVNQVGIIRRHTTDTEYHYTAGRIKAIFDVSESVYVSELHAGTLPVLSNFNAEVFAGGSFVKTADLADATIYDLLKDKDNKSILIISDYPAAAAEESGTEGT